MTRSRAARSTWTLPPQPCGFCCNASGSTIWPVARAREAGNHLRFRVGPGSTRCVTMRGVKEASHQIVTRRWDETKFEIGDTILIREGLFGVVLARYTPSGGARNDVYYIVELRREAEEH